MRKSLLTLGLFSIMTLACSEKALPGQSTVAPTPGPVEETDLVKVDPKPLEEGDIVSVDCGTLLDGFNGDSCYTFRVGEVSEEVAQLLDVTKKALYEGIASAQQGRRIGDIGYAVQTLCESHGYGVVREFVGHGIGRKMHEDPQVPNYGKKGNGPMIKSGLCIAIEPMISMGSPKIYMMDDNWTIKTRDGKPAAHFEHTIAIHKGKVEILSSFEDIEKAN